MAARYFKHKQLIAIALTCGLALAISHTDLESDLQQCILNLTQEESNQMHTLLGLATFCTVFEESPGTMAPSQGVVAYMAQHIEGDWVDRGQFREIYEQKIVQPCRLMMRIVNDLTANDVFEQNQAKWRDRDDYVGDIVRAYQLCLRIGRFANADIVYKGYKSAKLRASALSGVSRSDSHGFEGSSSHHILGSPKKIVAVVKNLF